MRSLLIATVVVLGMGLAPAFAQSACDGYPATKSWQAGGPNRLDEPDGANFPGWGRERGGLGDCADPCPCIVQSHPETVDGKQAQLDTLDPDADAECSSKLKLKYRSDDVDTELWPEWGVQGGEVLSITWEVYIADSQGSDSTMPAVKMRNGARRLRLDFDRNVVGADCPLSGWKESDGTEITSGGRPLGDGRYLLMSMQEWHVIRVDLQPDGTWDAWIDGGGSDWKHVSGTTPESSSMYVQFGATESKAGLRQWATSCVAWGEGLDEIPEQPSAVQEICQNGLDDDGDTFIDCDDPDCDCSVVIDPGCAPFEVIERFNTNFVEVETGRLPPGWAQAGYGSPAYQDEDPQPPGPGGVWVPSVFNLAPHDPNEELDDCDPGVEGFCDDQLAACIEACAGNESCEYQCDIDADFCAASQPLRIGLGFDEIPGTCGTTEDCYKGSIGVVKENIKIDDLVSLPIDWTQPVTLSIQAAGSDLSGAAQAGTGQWETFIGISNYTVNAVNSSPTLEWGSDGQANAVTHDDYEQLTLEVEGTPQNAAATGTLSFGVNFDFWDEGQSQPITLTPDKTSLAFFENVAVTYSWDQTIPLLERSPCTLVHTVNKNDPPAPGTISIWNGGGATPTMNYTITDDADWLEVLDPSGDLNGGELDQKTVTFDASGLQVLGPDDPPYTATITITSGEAYRSPKTIAVELFVVIVIDNPPDYDNDGDVDQDDFGRLQDCYTGTLGTVEPGFCQLYADLNCDGKVDSIDVTRFEACASGPNVPLTPDCLDTSGCTP